MTIRNFEGHFVLVTGAAGFIGSHLVDALLERGARVKALDNLSTGRRDNLAHCLDRIDFLEADIRDQDACREACRGVELVFHQAALGSVPRSMADPATTIDVNVTGTANVFAGARDAGIRRVIYASSSSVYGDSDRLPKREEDLGRPLSPYALSKAMDEALAGIFSTCFGMEMIGLRYFNVYGPRQDPDGPYAAVVPRFFASCLSGEAPTVHGDGEQSRDFTYVEDAVSANLLAASAPGSACGRAYNVAGGRQLSVNRLASLVRTIGGKGLEPKYVPARPGDVRHSRADLSLAQEKIGYAPRVEIEEGLERCLRFYAEKSGSIPLGHLQSSGRPE